MFLFIYFYHGALFFPDNHNQWPCIGSKTFYYFRVTFLEFINLSFYEEFQSRYLGQLNQLRDWNTKGCLFHYIILSCFLKRKNRNKERNNNIKILVF